MRSGLARLFQSGRPVLLAMTCLILWGCSGEADDKVDSSLVGTWQINGTAMTGSMQKHGTFLLRIDRDGTYILVSRGSTDFVIDSGRYVEALEGGFVRKTATGLEDRGTFEVSDDTLRLTSFYGELNGHRVAADDLEPTFTRLATLLRIAPRNHISHWASRAAQYAELWESDARLEYVSMHGFDERGLLLPTTSATIGFLSPSRNRLLLLSPTSTGSGAMVMSLASPGSRTPAPRAIPVPILDFAVLVERQREAGMPRRYATADLRWYSEGGGPPRLLWLANLEGSGGFDRHCLDVATASIVDCRHHAGDPAADLAALETRARATWAALQQRWSAGDSSSGDFSYTPPSDFDRCGGRGGSHNGVGCFLSSGEEIRGY